MSPSTPDDDALASDAGPGPDGTSDASARIAGLGYEAARTGLEEVVRRLETGGTSLEEALTLWEQGEALAARCQTHLDGARERLEAATARSRARTGTGESSAGGS